MEMSDCNDKNFFCANLVDDSVWKSVQAVTSCTWPKGVPRVREIGYLAKTSVEFVEEFLPKSFSCSLVPLASIISLTQRRRFEAQLHGFRRTRERNVAIASSTGITLVSQRS